MFDFFRSYRDAERAALAPLVDAALALDPADVPAFVEDLRREAPTVAARLAELLARTPVPSPDPTRRAPARSPSSASPFRLLPTGPHGNVADQAAAPRTVRAEAA